MSVLMLREGGRMRRRRARKRMTLRKFVPGGSRCVERRRGDDPPHFREEGRKEEDLSERLPKIWAREPLRDGRSRHSETKKAAITRNDEGIYLGCFCCATAVCT